MKREDKSMNKILIVGHPQSGYQEVERLLLACGMAPAQPSRREGFAPDQISETLCKAHNTPALHRLGNDREVQQVNVAPVWQSLAMDLMLGNIDQPLWGWADPKAVYLLDYWLTLDPSLHFILVYDRPHSVLTRTGLQEAASLTREALQQRLDAWSAYNAAVLSFHLRHPERCLLVHSEQVVRSADASLQHVQARIDAPWKDRLASTGMSTTHLVPTDVEDAKPGTQSLSLEDEIPFDASALSTVVASTLLKDQPGSQALYEELQASANLPLEADLAQGEDPALAMEAWLSFVAVQERLHSQHHLARQLQAGREQAERLAQERERLIEEERRLRVSERLEMTQHLAGQQQALQQIGSLTSEIETLRAKAESVNPDPQLTEENELLLSQLHQVQEELERYLIENQRLKKRESQSQQPTKPSRVAVYGAADRVKQQLSYRLGATLIDNSRTVGGWLSMPWAVRRVVAQYRRDLPHHQAKNLPPIHTYADAYEADRVRNHLSYRLGEAFLKNARSPVGWLRMPFALNSAVKTYRQQQSR